MPEKLETFTVRVPAKLAKFIRQAAQKEQHSAEAEIAIGAVCNSANTVTGNWGMLTGGRHWRALEAANPTPTQPWERGWRRRAKKD